MLPFNYAILQLFLRIDEADTGAVMEQLENAYQKSRQFKKPVITEALMTAEANGLLEETRYDLDGEQRLRVFYRVTDEGRAMIETYIGAVEA
ncbi:MAG: helix-turn-helix transcriptional regulator [Peptococcaceae bacterium]|nr:helix-turn-helix transcriptional regulator [Peptococcaceae bacterium]